MKTFTIHALTVILLLGMLSAASAQSNIVTEEQANIINAMNRQLQEDFQNQNMVRFLLDGSEINYFVSGLFWQSNFREGLGISEEQNRRIQEGWRNIETNRESDPDYMLLQGEDRELRYQFSQAVMSNAAPDILKEIQNKRLNIKLTMEEMQSEKRANLFDEILEPDQKKKIQEFHISTMSEQQYVFPNMFDVLDLSDDQKKQLDEIKKDMKPVFEKHIAKQVAYEAKARDKLSEGLREKLDAVPGQEGRQKLLDNMQKEIRAELQPEMNEILKSGKKLSDELKIKMFDILTDEQWARMLDLIDNPPDYVKKVIVQMRKWNEENANSSTGVWQPGPNSWRPGDAIPAQYRQERNERRRFPSGEN